MQSKSEYISIVESLFDFAEGASEFDFHGKKVQFSPLDEFRSDQGNYRSRYAILNESILYIASSGTPHSTDINRSVEKVEQLLVNQGLENIHLIYDLRYVENAGLNARRAILKGSKRLRHFWKSRSIVTSKSYRILIKIYRHISKDPLEDMYFSESVEDALHHLLIQQAPTGNGIEHKKIDYSDTEWLMNKSKEELVAMIQNFHKQGKETADKVLEAIGNISWEENFQGFEMEVQESEPHYDLMNALAWLQRDIAEIIEEYKDVNQNLELKVAERIVDFIDKESNLRAILDNSDRITWLMNNRFELIDFNIAFSNEIIKKYGKKPKVNQNILELIDDEREQMLLLDRFESTFKGKPGIYLDQDFIDGEERVLEIKTFPINELGKIKGVSFFVENITSLKDSQFKLIEKNRDLEKVNSELDSFVYRVSHDLRAPLTSILGLIELMKLETDTDRFADYVKLQEKSINKLDMFIKEIINLSRNSRLGVTVSKIDFHELLNEIFEGQSFIKSAETMERIIDIEEDLEFYSDPQRVSIILSNLVSNSLKYANTNQPDPFIKIRIWKDKTDCIIEVADNGIGISETFLPKIFEMFFRATEEASGSGIGLYIVKETVQKLSGKITAKSKVRQGTTFKVVLPNLKRRYEAAPKLDS